MAILWKCAQCNYQPQKNPTQKKPEIHITTGKLNQMQPSCYLYELKSHPQRQLKHLTRAQLKYLTPVNFLSRIPPPPHPSQTLKFGGSDKLCFK